MYIIINLFFILHDTNLLPCDIVENSQRGGFQKKFLNLNLKQFKSLTQFLLCWVKKLENVKPAKNHNSTNFICGGKAIKATSDYELDKKPRMLPQFATQLGWEILS